MVSEYFNFKINTEVFKKRIEEIIAKLKDKKLLIYGYGDGFEEINKIFNLTEKLNVVAFSDIKFEEKGKINGLLTVPPSEIKDLDFDAIIVTQERYTAILEYLKNKLGIEKELITIFKEAIPDESLNYHYLNKCNFEKYLNTLKKKLKNKKTIVYGSGVLFQLINSLYDLKDLNIIALSDIRFSEHKEGEEFLGYKVCAPDEIDSLNPDIILVATKKYIDIAENIYNNILENKNIKIRPLVKKPFREILKEIWDN